MKRIGIGVAAIGLVVAATSGSVAAQERPSVSHSESSRAAGPTCIVGGAATDCAGSAIGNRVGPVMVTAPIVMGPMRSPVTATGLIGPIGTSGADSDVDVARSTRSGSAVER